MVCCAVARVLIESDRWVDLSQRVFQHMLREVDIVSLLSLMGSIWVVRGIGDG